MNRFKADRWSQFVRRMAMGVSLFGVLMGALPGAYGQDSSRGAVFVLTGGNKLLSLNPDRPDRIKSRLVITGLAAGERLVGIDFRPATGRLYGVGSTSQLYVIDDRTGVATAIGAPFTPALQGNRFGVDFNPTVDRLRVVSGTGQNLRINPDTGAVVSNDKPLNFAVGDPNEGPSTDVVGSAYTNPDSDPATGTVLYGIDAACDCLVIQDPPNDGTLNTVGPLGVDTTRVVGFDIGFVRDGRNGAQGSVQALAVLQPTDGSVARLFRIDLATGQAQDLGVIDKGRVVVGLAIPIASARPEQVYALTGGNRLLGFNADSPDQITTIVSTTGLAPGERLVGIDFRPATGRLYGVGSTSQLYVIDIGTGLATRIGVPFTPLLQGQRFGVDFNPTVDRLRVVSGTGQNLRINPDTGAVVSNDKPLQFAAGDPNEGAQPNVVGSAYTNPDNDPATGTVLYGIDATCDCLVIQDPPNDGTLNTVGALGVRTTDAVSFDIGFISDDSADSQGSVQALAALRQGITSRLFRLDLATGQAQNVGIIDTRGRFVIGLAISISPFDY